MSKPKTAVYSVEVAMPEKKWHQVAVISLAAASFNQVSQYLDVKDEHGDTVVTLTWKSSVRLREVI